MIIDLLKYFARFPNRDGVLSLFTRGESTMSAYADLLTYVNALPASGLIPEVEDLVYGQTFDAVKRHIDKIVDGTFYLFVDFGEITSNRDRYNSIRDTQKMAATIAMRLPETADLIEESIASDMTLPLLNKMRAHMIADKGEAVGTWMQLLSDNHEIVPFLATELRSIGWTMMFNLEAADMLDVKTIMRSFQ